MGNLLNEIEMKRIKLLLIVVAALAYSCVKDNTVNSFNELNEVTISGLNEHYTFTLFEAIEISPTVVSSKGDLSNFEYRWYVYNNDHRFEADTISREKILDVTIGGTPGIAYTLVFKVIDATTGIFYSKNMKMEVVGELTRGTLFLCEENGLVDVNFMNGDSTILRSIYSSSNPGEALVGDPSRIFFMDPNAYAQQAMKNVYIMMDGEDGGVVVNPITFKKVITLRDNFYVAPTAPTLKATQYHKSVLSDYLILNGKLVNRAANMGEPIWKPELLINAAGEPIDYQLADLFLFPEGDPVVFDNKYGRFLRHEPSNMGQIHPYVGGSKDAFDYNSSGMTMKYNTQIPLPTGSEGRYSFAVVEENNTNKQYFLRYLIGKRDGASANSIYADEKREITAAQHPGLYAANTFASDFNTLPGILWYASGSKLYSLNTTDPNPTEVLQKDFSSEGITIDIIRFHTFSKIDPESGDVTEITELRMAVSESGKSSLGAGMIYLQANTLGGVNIDEISRKMGIADKIVDFAEKFN